LISILLQLAQALFLWLTANYFVYLGLQIGMTLLENLILSLIAKRLYPYINTNRSVRINPEAKRENIKNTKAMM